MAVDNKNKKLTTFHMDAANDKVVKKCLVRLTAQAKKMGISEPKKKDVINFMLAKAGEISIDEYFK